MPTSNDRGPHRPRTNIQYHVENGWAVPDQPQTPPRRTSTQEQRRAAARRARAKRRRLRQLALIGTACGILVVSGVITALLPAKGADAPLTSDAPANTRLVAPVPYAGSNGSTGTAQALNWGTVGPQRQSADTGYTYTALPAAPAALPAFGRVDTSWFADAAFLGDSLTAGFCANEYNIDVGGALVCGYEGISPNTIVNRATVTNPDRGEEVPLDVLAAAQPAKLYILIGTNALVQPGNDDSFLAYYGKMLDDLRTALPNTVFYVQSVLPATQEKVADSLPGLAPDRLAVINAAIQQLCAERGAIILTSAPSLPTTPGISRRSSPSPTACI